jgi:enamine deaminase RidA (YjgF/YER057c/UK114 family)
MAESIQDRLAAMGVTLPVAAAPAANYVPFALHGGVLYVSGQLPMANGAIVRRGKLGLDVTVNEGREAARLCAVNILAQANAALSGDLERIGRIVRITGFVASTPDFTEQHLVVNGASDFLAQVLGERGHHARAAVGVASLPLDAAVEIDAIIAVDTP